MAKYECQKRGRIKNDALCRKILRLRLDGVAAEEKRAKKYTTSNKKQFGPRALAWNEFKKNGKFIDACNAVNKVYDEGTFSKSDICTWIFEELEKVKETKKSKDIDEAR